MSRRLRSQNEEEGGLEQVVERMVKGMRNEMSTVMWRIERSRDMSPEALKNMIKNGMDAMMGAVEKVMYGISDGLAKERKEKEQKEEDRKWRTMKENDMKEEKRRKEEERVRRLEEKLEKLVRETEDRWKEREERVRVMEDKMERELVKKVGEERRSKEWTRNIEVETVESELRNVKERVSSLEDKVKEGVGSPGKKDSEVQVRIGELEKEIARNKAERQEFEWNSEEEKGIQEAKDSEKDMEMKLEGAMEQVKVLNLDFGKECVDRRAMVREAVCRIKEKVTGNDKEELDRLMQGVRVDIMGRSTCKKKTGKGEIHTVPVLITCGCQNVKERLEVIVRRAGLVTTCQWPKECMEFIEKVREKVEMMGFGKKEHYTRVRPVRKDGRILVRVDTKRIEGGKFRGLAYWRVPLSDKEQWKRINNMMEPIHMIGK